MAMRRIRVLKETFAEEGNYQYKCGQQHSPLRILEWTIQVAQHTALSHQSWTLQIQFCVSLWIWCL